MLRTFQNVEVNEYIDSICRDSIVKLQNTIAKEKIFKVVREKDRSSMKKDRE